MDELKNRSLSELLGDLSRETGTLVQKELELARVELGRIIQVAAQRLAFLGVGAAICHAGVLALTAVFILGGIALGLAPVVSTLIVAVVCLALGGYLTHRGLAGLKAADLMPTETVRTVKETATWARNQGR
jgi:hypothetical protein